jgi:transcriptional regulator with XRE-family HTH domain
MPITGNQIKAARALAGMDQKALAEAAQIGINTVRNIEGSGPEPAAGRIDTLNAIREALQRAGVIFVEEGQMSSDGLGVRLMDRR